MWGFCVSTPPYLAISGFIFCGFLTWSQLWSEIIRRKILGINNSKVLNCLLFWVAWWNRSPSCSDLTGTWVIPLSSTPISAYYLPFVSTVLIIRSTTIELQCSNTRSSTNLGFKHPWSLGRYPPRIRWGGGDTPVLRGSTFGRWLGNGPRILMNRISALIKEALDSSLPLLPREDTAGRGPSVNQSRLTRHHSWNFLASRSVSSRFLLFASCSSMV
jgi:hypothetical protein